MAEQIAGGCACGRVRYTVSIDDHDAYLCHCRMCQRATGSVSIAFKGVKVADVDWAREPDWYDSSPIAMRPFCRECGTSLGFQFKDGSDKMDLTVASFDDPSPFVPKHHFGTESMHRAWLNTEVLPEQRTDGYQKLIDKWVDATGSFPRVNEVQVFRWTASDGVELAYHQVGEGRPAVLLHGLFSDANMNWIKFGHAARIAAAGFRVIMPDLRAHGLSSRPHGAEHYPVGILARDLRELVTRIELTEFDLGGFSLGARTTVEGVGEGLKPRRAFLGGAGLEGLKNWQRRKTFFIEAIDLFDRVQRGDPHLAFDPVREEPKVDRVAARHLLDSFADAFMDWLQAFTMPTMVVCGDQDDDNGSAAELAAAMPNAIFTEVPGTHMSSVTRPELGEAIAQFLARP